MGRHATVLGLFLTHPEVVVDPAVPVTEWGLSDQGRARARAFAHSLADQGWDLIASSDEQKAIETAEVLRSVLGVPLMIDELLGENDRSATGYLPPDEFERTADSFFAHPTTSIRGWETASAAQDRIVSTVRRISADAPGRRIAYVAHGAVGSLLLSDLMRVPISRELDQPRQGCWFTFDPTAWSSAQGWQPFPEA